MSQAGITSSSSGPVPPTVATSYVTDVNSPSVPAANVEKVFGGTSTANTSNGIRTDGSSGSNTLTVQLTNRFYNTVTTTDATPTALITFPLGATPGTYNFFIQTCGYDSTNNLGDGFTVCYCARTDGANATKVGSSAPLDVTDDSALTQNSVVLTLSGNNLIITVTGSALTNIGWTALGTYVFAHT